MPGAMRALRYTQAAEFACAAIGMGYIQRLSQRTTASTPPPRRSHHPPVRVLTHIRMLDDCFGEFLVRVSCACRASRHIEPEGLARLVGWLTTLEALAARLRCSRGAN
jgi:hypothetical protein